MPTRETVLFDFDHTVIRHDAFFRFCVSLLQREPVRLGLAVPCSALVWPGLLAERTHLGALSAILWSATLGIDGPELARRMDAYVARDEIQAWLHPDAKLAMARHRERGESVVVVTGCEQGLASRLCEVLGLGEVSVIGSRIEARSAGFVVTEHCIGPQKVKSLSARGVHAPWSHVYSDSQRDLPIMRPAQGITLVNPSSSTRSRVLAELGARTKVVRW